MVARLQGYKVVVKFKVTDGNAFVFSCYPTFNHNLATWAVQNSAIFSFHFLDLCQFNFHVKFCFFRANSYLVKSKR